MAIILNHYSYSVPHRKAARLSFFLLHCITFYIRLSTSLFFKMSKEMWMDLIYLLLFALQNMLKNVFGNFHN